jgi:hypothetical protein
MQDLKFIDVREFVESGFLQEVNRRALHPVGLALVITKDDEGNYTGIAGIADYREDPDGIMFADLTTIEANEKYERVHHAAAQKSAARWKKFLNGGNAQVHDAMVVQSIGTRLAEPEPNDEQ